MTQTDIVAVPGQPGHVAAFAASHYARSMTGTALNITGGSVAD